MKSEPLENKRKWKDLPDELKICYIIYEFEQWKEKVYFSKLVDVLKKELPKSKISKILEKLSALGVIDEEWEKIGRKWTKTFRISNEAKELIAYIYNICEKKNTEKLAEEILELLKKEERITISKVMEVFKVNALDAIGAIMLLKEKGIVEELEDVIE